MDVEKFFKECLINMGYVTFEIAKKLKEKGYPFNTSHHYDKDGNIIVALCDYDERCEYPMPEIHQVLKWLREEHHLHCEVVGAAYGYNLIISDTPDKGGTDRYYSHANNDGPNYAGAWDKYEDCVMYGIEYVLDNLI